MNGKQKWVEYKRFNNDSSNIQCQWPRNTFWDYLGMEDCETRGGEAQFSPWCAQQSCRFVIFAWIAKIRRTKISRASFCTSKYRPYLNETMVNGRGGVERTRMEWTRQIALCFPSWPPPPRSFTLCTLPLGHRAKHRSASIWTLIIRYVSTNWAYLLWKSIIVPRSRFFSSIFIGQQLLIWLLCSVFCIRCLEEL